eukprot:PhM_4_TR2843/c0_g1_i2/m.36945
MSSQEPGDEVADAPPLESEPPQPQPEPEPDGSAALPPQPPPSVTTLRDFAQLLRTETTLLLETLGWGGDLRMADMTREPPPFRSETEPGPALLDFSLPSSIVTRTVNEATRTATTTQQKSVATITSRWFIVSDRSTKALRRVCEISAITHMLLHDVKRKKGRVLNFLVCFSPHVPERDFLCELVCEPENGSGSDDLGALVRVLTRLRPDVALRTLNADDDVTLHWESSLHVTDAAATVRRLAEERAAHLINEYPSRSMEAPAPAPVVMTRSSILFKPPTATVEPNHPPPPVSPLKVVPAPQQRRDNPPVIAHVATVSVGVSATSTTPQDTTNKTYVSRGIGDDTLFLRPAGFATTQCAPPEGTESGTSCRPAARDCAGHRLALPNASHLRPTHAGIWICCGRVDEHRSRQRGIPPSALPFPFAAAARRELPRACPRC